LGRHINSKAADRICKICKDGVEDETNFLVKCKNFENIRKPYLETIYTLCPNLKTCNNENIFIWIMGCENPEALRTFRAHVGGRRSRLVAAHFALY
jgi:nicotinic acid mononucleotide adenylyltransferase